MCGLLASTLPLAACGGFFQCVNQAGCPAASTGTGTTTGGSTNTLDVAYVAYTTSAGASVISGFNVAAGTLVGVNTVTLPFVPVAMAVNPKNTLLYVASVPGYTNPGVYVYSIATDGTLAAANGGLPLVTDLTGAMSISPDGNFLFTVEAINQTMNEYGIDGSTGALTARGALLVASLSCAPTASAPVLPTCGVAVSPANSFVVASLGTQGDAFFNYTSSGGITNSSFTTTTAGTQSGDFSVALDANNNAYVAQTSTLTVYGVTSSSVTNKGYYTYPAGSAPRSVVVDPASKFVYTANVGTSKITGFAIGSSPALTVLSGAPYAAPANVSSLGIDRTDAYLIAAGYDGTAGVQLYSIASTGVLAALGTAPTSTINTNPVLVAMTH